jgi:hypothetical protein
MGRVSFGDRVILVETYRTGVESLGQWQDSIPLRPFTGALLAQERADLEEFRSTAPRVAGAFFDTEKSKKIQPADLFGALWRGRTMPNRTCRSRGPRSTRSGWGRDVVLTDRGRRRISPHRQRPSLCLPEALGGMFSARNYRKMVGDVGEKRC